MQSGMSNKAEAIANLIFDKNTVDLLIKNDLLPTTLVYDENFNTGEGRETINASFNKSNKVTTIGPRFMSILSNNNVEYRKQAIRKLIHEKLHDKLHSDGNEHFIKDIESIYDEFCKYLDDAEFSKPILEKYLKKIKLNKSLDEYYNGFKKYKYLSKQKNTSDLVKYLETFKKEELYLMIPFSSPPLSAVRGRISLPAYMRCRVSHRHIPLYRKTVQGELSADYLRDVPLL